jgi:hypothetical protein
MKTLWIAVLTLVIGFVYNMVTAIVYVMWGRYVGWPSYTNELVMRSEHLLPALVFAMLAGALLGLVLRDGPPRGPGIALGILILVLHVLSYHGVLHAPFEYVAAAVIEGAVLLLVVAAAYSFVRRPRQPVTPSQY